MAVPSYTTDLTTIVDFDGTPSSPTVAEPASGWIAGRTPSIGTDYPIQSSNHAMITMNAIGKAGVLCTNASSWTWNTSHYLFGWIVWLAPGAIATKAAGGVAMLCGNTTTDYKIFYVGGNDFGSYPYGGWQNFIVDPTKTGGEANNGSPNGTNFNFVGAGANVLTAVSKGDPLGFDKFSYGRGEFRVVDGQAGNYATFAGMATTNDNTSNRWGLFQAVDGGYLFAGLMILGYGALVNFIDSNRYIVIKNTPQVNSNFHQIEIRNASSVVSWINIGFTQLGVTGTYTTASKCLFVMTDNATVTKDACTFTDMSTFVYQSNATITNSTYRRCGQITPGGATFTGCTITNSTATSAVVASSPANAALISGTDFTSDGTGHAIEIGGTAANMTLTGNTYTSYDSDTSSVHTGGAITGNEAIYVNIASGSPMDLNISGGTTPSVASAGVTVNVVANPITVAVTTKDVDGAVVGSANVFLKAASGGSGILPVSATVNTITRVNATTAEATHAAVHNMKTGDKVYIRGANQAAYNGVFTITLVGVATPTTMYRYTLLSDPGVNATGTLTATFVFLKGLTDAGTGVLSMSRVIPADQNVTGWVRRATSGTLTITATSGSGTVATLTFATQGSIPFPAGIIIKVTGLTPAGYNGVYVSTGGSTSTVTYASTTTGSMTVAGTVANRLYKTGVVTGTVTSNGLDTTVLLIPDE